jgi:hypothetical protein
MTQTAHERITDEVAGWEGVETRPGRFGSTRYLLGRRELGHMHGDTVLDLPLPPPLKRELLAAGTVEQHRWTKPTSGWVSFRLQGPADVDQAIELLRGQYERARKARHKAA